MEQNGRLTGEWQVCGNGEIGCKQEANKTNVSNDTYSSCDQLREMVLQP